MELVSSRERRIILQLLRSRHQFVSIRELAELLHVSSRTIHRELKQVERTLAEYELSLLRVTGSGIRVEGESAQMEALQEQLHEAVEVDTTQEERLLHLLFLLIKASEPVKVAFLANKVQLSKTAVSVYLDALEAKLAEYMLTITRRRGVGVELEGEENEKRKALVQLTMEQLDQASIYPFTNDYEERNLHQFLQQFIKEQQMTLVEKYVMDHIAKLSYSIADNAYVALITYISITIQRIKQEQFVSLSPPLLTSLQKTEEYTIAAALSRELETNLSLTFSTSEIGCIAVQIQGAKRNETMHRSDPLFELQVQAFIQLVAASTKLPQLEKDEAFTNSLLAHIEPAISRAREGIQTYNPLTEKIEHDYKEVVAAVHKALETVFPAFRFGQGEVAFLALHFASAIERQRSRQRLHALVVCASGIGTSKMLASRLQNEFPEITQVTLSSYLELKELEPDQFDLLVSTISLDQFNRPYLHVNPLLPAPDVKRMDAFIQQELPTIYTKRKHITPAKTAAPKRTETANFEPKLAELQTLAAVSRTLWKRFIIDKAYQSQTGLFAYIDQQAAEQLIIEERGTLAELLQTREELGGMGIPDTRMALYHSRSNDIEQPAFWMMALSSPISIMGMDNRAMKADRLFILAAPDNLPLSCYELFSKISSLILEEHIQPLIRSADQEALSKELAQLLTAHIQQFTDHLGG
ncbi:BglG family transcription antiterminator [Terribacillus sp. DMT04]|uniref:BglG family transcription antiterminator n=1 Tax=Terribacillus sp. DMT04 TaxID=2850441 RepID=UPI001C2C647B|nr:transcription antiterminator [Terribacillus sp. DMT04]QXE01302.1 transcription antiterminator [Terribacillus sp. DMT04]